jgi:hypothetical protein
VYHLSHPFTPSSPRPDEVPHDSLATHRYPRDRMR